MNIINSMIKFYQTTLFILLLLGISCDDDDIIISHVTVTIDLGTEKKITSVSGFLHGISQESPHDSLVSSLNPKLIRSGNYYLSVYNRRPSLQAKSILVVSDLWHNYSNGGQFMPYDDYELYRQFLRDLIKNTRDLNLIYDLWNEPDQTGEGGFWKGTQEQFLETYKVAHDVLREELGANAVISGPSSHWNLVFIQSFLDYCLANNMTVDVLSWHEFQPDNDLSKVRNNLRMARARYLHSEKYSSLGIKEIQVNEYGFHDKYRIPSFILGYLYYLEEGKADGACRTCWTDCWNNTIGGLLSEETLQPTAAWWVYKLYAESITHRLASTTSNNYVTPIASLTPGEESIAQVIIGNHYHDIVSDFSVRFTQISEVPELKDVSEVKIKIYKIPDSEGEPVVEPEFISEAILPVINNEVKVEQEFIAAKEVYLIRLYQ